MKILITVAAFNYRRPKGYRFFKTKGEFSMGGITVHRGKPFGLKQDKNTFHLMKGSKRASQTTITEFEYDELIETKEEYAWEELGEQYQSFLTPRSNKTHRNDAQKSNDYREVSDQRRQIYGPSRLR